MTAYHFRRSRTKGGAPRDPLVPGVTRVPGVTLSLGSSHARSPRRLSTMIAVFGGRGPDSGPVAPQTTIMQTSIRLTIMDTELSAVRPYDSGMFVAELPKPGGINRQQAPAEGRASPRSHGRSKAGT